MIIRIDATRNGMFNLKDRGVEYPINPQTESPKSTPSSRVEFACDERFFDIFAPPVGATHHINDKREEYYYETSFSDPMKEYIEHRDIKDAMSVGWVIPTQGFIEVTIDDPENISPHPRTDLHLSDIRCKPKQNSGGYNYIVEIDLKWVPIVSEGVSILLKQPAFASDRDFTVLPKIIDVDNIPTKVRVPLLITEPMTLELNHGTPLAQAIPINKDLRQVETEILPPPEN